MFGNRGLFVFRRKKTEPDPDFSGGLYGEHHETEAGRDETVRRKEEAEKTVQEPAKEQTRQPMPAIEFTPEEEKIIREVLQEYL